jgi:murein DD-endopeptidase MepM/ murein hydrolase activator NlpD
LASQHDVADEASTSTRSSRRTPVIVRRRTAFAIVAAAILALAVVVPTIASWPVASRSSYVSRGFTSYHKAYDLAAPRGTRIVPTMSGTVVFAGWRSNCGGYQVWVSHGNGLYTAYYHMSREISWKGRGVTRQQSTLGYVGATGCATGPHLHIEVWHGYPWHSGSYRVSPWRYIDNGTYEPYRYR